MKIKACPRKCKFDWVDFHRRLDIAVAHMINEREYPDFPMLPSSTSVMDFMMYSNAKQQAQKAKNENK